MNLRVAVIRSRIYGEVTYPAWIPFIAALLDDFSISRDIYELSLGDEIADVDHYNHFVICHYGVNDQCLERDIRGVKKLYFGFPRGRAAVFTMSAASRRKMESMNLTLLDYNVRSWRNFFGLPDTSPDNGKHTIFDYDPTWSVLDPGPYLRSLESTGPSLPIYSSLGCDYSCHFCREKTKYEPFPIDRTIKHIKQAIEQTGVNNFIIEDDLFNNDMEHVRDFCRALLRGNLNISWQCLNGLRADNLSHGIIDLLSESGCSHITLGLEHADEVVLRDIGKAVAFSFVRDMVKYARKRDIAVSGYFILGLPGVSQTKDIVMILKTSLMPFDYLHYSSYDYSLGSRNKVWQLLGYSLGYLMPFRLLRMGRKMGSRFFYLKIYSKVRRELS